MEKSPARLNVLDLFSGLEGWSEPFRERGHSIYRVELDEHFPAEHRDIFTFKVDQLPWKPDVVLASPPCTAFTVMCIGRNWNKDHTPKHPAAEKGLALLNKTLEVIAEINPRFFIIENPRAKMRKMPQMEKFERRTVTYCQYGKQTMKPTDLWGGFPPSFFTRPSCKNGDSCHVSAPRGSRTGTQGQDSAESAKIPYQLALSVCFAVEKDIQEG